MRKNLNNIIVTGSGVCIFLFLYVCAHHVFALYTKENKPRCLQGQESLSQSTSTRTASSHWTGVHLTSAFSLVQDTWGIWDPTPVGSMLNSTLDLSQKAGTYLCLLLKAQSWFRLPPNQGWVMKMKSDPYRLGKIKGEPVYKWQKEKGHQGEAPRLSSKAKLNSKQFCLWVSMNTLWSRTARKAYLASPLESISLYKRSVSKKFQGSLLLSSCWCPSKTQYIFVSLSHLGDCLARPWAWMPFSSIPVVHRSNPTVHCVNSLALSYCF